MAGYERGHFCLVSRQTNPFTVDLQRNNMHQKIFLVSSSITGAPVTGNIPNNSYYNIIFENVPVKNTIWFQNDESLLVQTYHKETKTNKITSKQTA